MQQSKQDHAEHHGVAKQREHLQCCGAEMMREAIEGVKPGMVSTECKQTSCTGHAQHKQHA